MNNFTAIVLATDFGADMKSETPKYLHKICGKPVCKWVIDASVKAGVDKITLVIGNKCEEIKDTFGEAYSYAVQEEGKGTVHALMQAVGYINSDELCIILNGDTPLITEDTIKTAVLYHEENKNAATVVKDNTGTNSGIYILSADLLRKVVTTLSEDNSCGQYSSADIFEILLNLGVTTGIYVLSDLCELQVINDRIGLSQAEGIIQKRINTFHMRNGVTINLCDTVIIEDGVEIGTDTVINQNVTIKSGTKIGKKCIIGTGCVLEEAIISDNVDILSSVIIKSSVGENTHVGPFAYIRPNCSVGKNVKVGDFVELKNSNIDEGTKISHLTYVGDSDVGKRVNFGCGTVTVNYDGKNKFRTTIGDDAFIGCNTNLVAPVKLNDGAFTAAGSTITDDVPENNLAIARARQVNKSGWKRPEKIEKK